LSCNSNSGIIPKLEVKKIQNGRLNLDSFVDYIQVTEIAINDLLPGASDGITGGPPLARFFTASCVYKRE